MLEKIAAGKIDFTKIFAMTEFNMSSIKKWNLNENHTISYMFMNARFKNAHVLIGLNTSKIHEMRGLFLGTIFIPENQTIWNDTNRLNVNDELMVNVNDESILNDVVTTYSFNFSKWDTGNVRTMSEMFAYSNLTILQSIDNWDTKNVLDMSRMFTGFRNYILYPKYYYNPLSGWDTGNVIDMSGMFADYKHSTIIDDVLNLPLFNKWNVSYLKDSSFMFANTNMNANIKNIISVNKLKKDLTDLIEVLISLFNKLKI